jgi:hypothetical protein
MILMNYSQHIKYGALSGLILLCTIMLSVTIDNQGSVFAQISPAPQKFGSDESSTNSSPSTNNNSNADDDGDDYNNGSIDSSSSNDDDDDDGSDAGSYGDDEQSSSSDDEQGETTEDFTESSDSNDSNIEQSTSEGLEETNPLVEAINKKVSEELSAAGITIPNF